MSWVDAPEAKTPDLDTRAIANRGAAGRSEGSRVDCRVGLRPSGNDVEAADSTPSHRSIGRKHTGVRTLPVDASTLVAFALVASAIVVSPGPDTFLILRSALVAPATGYAAVLGVQLGLLVHTAFAVFGLSFLIASSPVLFNAVAIVGAAYLAWLGIDGLRGSTRLMSDGQAVPTSPVRACRDALLTNLLNPKVLVLFLALYPNFVAAERGHVPAQLMTLSATLIAINVAWQAPLAWAAGLVRRWLVRPRIRATVTRLASVVLIVCAALLLYEHFH